MISFLKVFLSLVWIWMVYIVISTSLETGLFENWDFLASIPWMRATLWDFYANILLIFLWLAWRERSILTVVIWAILFFCLGSIASIAYVLLQLYPLTDQSDVASIFKRKPVDR